MSSYGFMMDFMEQVDLETELDHLLDRLLPEAVFADTVLCDDSVRVSIRDRVHGVDLLCRLEYDLTVLEPGLEEAAKRIHLDWLFA